MDVIKKYKDCQFFQKQTTKHANPLRPINISSFELVVESLGELKVVRSINDEILLI
jgi:hypothetical protein